MSTVPEPVKIGRNIASVASYLYDKVTTLPVRPVSPTISQSLHEPSAPDIRGDGVIILPCTSLKKHHHPQIDTAGPVIPLLEDASTGKRVIGIQKVTSHVRKPQAAPGLAVLAGAGQVAAQLTAASQLSGLYKVVIDVPEIARKFAAGLLELVPTNLNGQLTTQLREIGGAAVATANIVPIGALAKSALIAGSILTAVGAIATEMRMARIESKLNEIRDTQLSMIDIPLWATVQHCTESLPVLQERLYAIESCPTLEQRSDFDSRLRDLEEKARLNIIQSNLWIETELSKLKRTARVSEISATSGRVQQMWTLLSESYKVQVLSTMLMLRKARLRNESMVMMKTYFKEFSDQISAFEKASQDLLLQSRTALETAMTNATSGWFSRATNWVASGHSKFAEIMSEFSPWEDEQKKFIQQYLTSFRRALNFERNDQAASNTSDFAALESEDLWLEINQLDGDKTSNVSSAGAPLLMLSDKPHNATLNFFGSLKPDDLLEMVTGKARGEKIQSDKAAPSRISAL